MRRYQYQRHVQFTSPCRVLGVKLCIIYPGKPFDLLTCSCVSDDSSRVAIMHFYIGFLMRLYIVV